MVGTTLVRVLNIFRVAAKVFIVKTIMRRGSVTNFSLKINFKINHVKKFYFFCFKRFFFAFLMGLTIER